MRCLGSPDWSGKSFLRVFLLLSVFLFSPEGSVRAASDPSLPEEGLWLVQSRDGVFYIHACQERKLCGWLVGLSYTEARPPVDSRGNSQCNLLMMWDFSPFRDGEWLGNVLDPRSGNVYKARLWSPKKDVLKLRGYVGIPLFGKTQTWTRYRGAPIGAECRMSGSS